MVYHPKPGYMQGSEVRRRLESAPWIRCRKTFMPLRRVIQWNREKEPLRYPNAPIPMISENELRLDVSQQIGIVNRICTWVFGSFRIPDMDELREGEQHEILFQDFVRPKPPPAPPRRVYDSPGRVATHP